MLIQILQTSLNSLRREFKKRGWLPAWLADTCAQSADGTMITVCECRAPASCVTTRQMWVWGITVYEGRCLWTQDTKQVTRMSLISIRWYPVPLIYCWSEASWRSIFSVSSPLWLSGHASWSVKDTDLKTKEQIGILTTVEITFIQPCS